MAKIDEILKENKGRKGAVYGLGTETGRFLQEYGDGFSIAGLLDGFRRDGEMYGYPIIPIQDAIRQGIAFIIVVARPGSCKAIAKRIGDICRDNDIELFDVRGRDLLEVQTVSYDFSHINGECRARLIEKIEQADIVSFDLFDTLVMRKVFGYTDMFALLENKLRVQGIYIPDFAGLRLSAEKELSRTCAPKLVEIYEEVLKRTGGSFITAKELAEMEWELDRTLLLPRYAVCDIFRDTVKKGKRVAITTDSYYCEDQIQQILADFQLSNFEKLFVSCDKGTSKTLRLFERLLDMNGGNSEGILHIGDDEAADIIYAEKYHLDTYRVYSGSDLFGLLGGLGAEREIKSLSDSVKTGLFVSKLFNDPFVFEEGDRQLTVSNVFEIGYLFCAPVITDFTVWLSKRVRQENIPQVLFCARDGFLIGRLFRRIDRKTKAFYFLTSRTAAIRAGMEDEQDISYVDSMKYFGTEEDNLRVRFGIEPSDNLWGVNRNQVILTQAKTFRENYKKYIGRLRIGTDKVALFDFVAKGTTQMYLQRMFAQHIKGFYFLQPEPEFMADKGLDIEPFYFDEEKDTSVMFEDYYILETILTSPYPTLEGFDQDGNPMYAQETRSKRDIRCLELAQEGIQSYFDDYVGILPETDWEQNKRLDEMFLSLINHVRITDQEFLALTVEDSFFGRMTAITDVIG